MTAWHTKPMLAFDLESTGVDVERDRIVTACTALLKPTPTPPWDIDVKSRLIDPGVDIPAGATAVHGITTEFAQQHGEKPVTALDAIAGELALALTAGVPVVGMNLAYDLTLLDRELRRHSLLTVDERLGRPIAPVLDIYVLDKAVDPYRRGSRRLTDLCATYRVRIDGAHDSTFDALASARVLYRIGQRIHMPADQLRALYADRRNPDEVVEAFRGLRGLGPMDLHRRQVLWRAEQQESLADYLRGLGKDPSDVDRHWPMRPWYGSPVAQAETADRLNAVEQQLIERPRA
jgi:DNA polymerase-3 subunit epsilon